MKGRRVSYEATVVVPVLNQRRSWLRQCIVSACTQTAPVETIVVTSPRTRASTIQELRELSRKYGNVRVLPEEGKGFAAALNTGIRAAPAARVGFLLSDDWLDPDAVEQCLGHDADIVSTGLRGRAADGVRILEQVSRTTGGCRASSGRLRTCNTSSSSRRACFGRWAGWTSKSASRGRTTST